MLLVYGNVNEFLYWNFMTLVNSLISSSSYFVVPLSPLEHVTVRGLSRTGTKAPGALGSSPPPSLCEEACFLVSVPQCLPLGLPQLCPCLPHSSRRCRVALLSALLGLPPVLRVRQSRAHRVFLLSGIMFSADCCPESKSHRVTHSVH